MDAKEWSKAAAAYQSITQANPGNANAWFQLGAALHELGQYDKAVAAFEKAQAAGWPPGQAAFRRVRSLARSGKKDEALALLDRMVRSGFTALQPLQTNPDLASLRSDPRYAELLAAVQKATDPCNHNPEYRKFDFWVGEWDVFAGGQKAGENTIQLTTNNCILYENWTGAGGGTGKSINFFNSQTGKWQQIWVDSSGNNLQFTGEFRDGTLYYTAESLAQNGAKTLHKLTFFNQGANQVRQFWEQSTDGGKTWSVVFDGTYIRKKK